MVPLEAGVRRPSSLLPGRVLGTGPVTVEGKIETSACSCCTIIIRNGLDELAETQAKAHVAAAFLVEQFPRKENSCNGVCDAEDAGQITDIISQPVDALHSHGGRIPKLNPYSFVEAAPATAMSEFPAVCQLRTKAAGQELNWKDSGGSLRNV